MRRTVLCVVLLLVSLVPAAQVRADEHDPVVDLSCTARFCAGAARGDITPPVTTPMWGYTAREAGFSFAGDPQGFPTSSFGRHVTSADTEGYCKTFQCNRGIQTRLYANAFVLRDAAGVKLAIVQVDLGGLPAEIHQAVANRLYDTGIDRGHLLISATHTHHGPGGTNQYQGYALLGGDELDPRVFDAVAGGITNAVKQANASMTPATLAWGQTELRANHNRRTRQWCLNPEVSCTNGSWDGTGPDPANRTLTGIRLDTTEGTPIGFITNFANHGTIGDDDNLLFSGDNQAFAVREVERMIEDSPPPCLSPGPCPPRKRSLNGWPVNALLNAAQGDQSPDADAGGAWAGLRGATRDYAAMEGAGKLQAPGMFGLWESLGSSLTDQVTLDVRSRFLCFCGQEVGRPGPNYDGDPLWNRVSPFSALGAGGVTMPDGTRNPFVTPTQGYKSYALLGAGTNPSITRIMSIRINDLLIASMPGEPTVQFGRRLIDAARAAGGGTFSAAIIAGLANDYDSYMTTQEEYRAYMYEGSFMLFGPQMGQALIEEHEALARAIAQGIAVRECPPGLSCPAPHPDTSFTSAPVLPLTPDDFAGTVVSQPAGSVQRMRTVSFSWNGGNPSAEWRPGADRVRIERRNDDGDFVPVSGDARDVQTLLRYEKESGRHVWTVSWDVPRDAPTGEYWFHVFGRRTNIPGTAESYDLVSESFTVGVSTDLSAIADGSVVRVTYPRPSPATSFRYRPAAPDGGSVTAIVDGECLTAAIGADGTATFGGTVSSLVSVSDAYGNTASTVPACALGP